MRIPDMAGHKNMQANNNGVKKNHSCKVSNREWFFSKPPVYKYAVLQLLPLLPHQPTLKNICKIFSTRRPTNLKCLQSQDQEHDPDQDLTQVGAAVVS